MFDKLKVINSRKARLNAQIAKQREMMKFIMEEIEQRCGQGFVTADCVFNTRNTAADSCLNTVCYELRLLGYEVNEKRRENSIVIEVSWK